MKTIGQGGKDNDDENEDEGDQEEEKKKFETLEELDEKIEETSSNPNFFEIFNNDYVKPFDEHSVEVNTE